MHDKDSTETTAPGALVFARQSVGEGDYDTYASCVLSSQEIQSLNLTQCNLVVLTCCHGGDGEAKAEGLIGLGRAFLYAGAKAAILSQREVPDSPHTVHFIKSLYEHYMMSLKPAAALQAAMKQMIAEKIPDNFWSAYYVLGSSD